MSQLLDAWASKVAGLDRKQWRDRAHVIAMAATPMRRVLVDYARRIGRDKRGDGVLLTSLDPHDVAADVPERDRVDVVELDEALVPSEMDPGKVRSWRCDLPAACRSRKRRTRSISRRGR